MLQTGGVTFYQHVQHGGTSLRITGLGARHAVDGHDGGDFMPSGLEGFPKRLQEKGKQGREGRHTECPDGGARLSSESRPSPGADGCRYL